MRMRVKHVNRIRAKGRVYYYHRKTGERLPDDPEQAARRALQINSQFETPSARDVVPGTLGDLIARYRSSPDYTELAPKTRKDYARYLDDLGERFGPVWLEAVDRSFVFELRDQLAEKPRTANYMVQVLRRLLSFAVDRGAIPQHPAQRIRLLRTGPGHQPWSDAAIERFRSTATPEIRWAFEIGLYTGQRQGDVLAMQWSHYHDGGIEVAQRKTGQRLWIPVHPTLIATVNTIPKRATLILTTPTGRSWQVDHFRHTFRRTLDRAGLEGLTYHGLRHTTGKLLAEAGCSDREIMAILGHRTAAMVGKYTRGAEQKRLAKAAISRLPSGTNPDHRH